MKWGLVKSQFHLSLSWWPGGSEQSDRYLIEITSRQRRSLGRRYIITATYILRDITTNYSSMPNIGGSKLGIDGQSYPT